MYCNYRYPCPYPSLRATRKDYLFYLMLNFVATPEEQEEFRSLERNQIENIWNKEIERLIESKNKKVKQNIIDYKKRIFELRSTVEGLEYANKYQELLNYVEKYNEVPDSWQITRGFVSGWGD